MLVVNPQCVLEPIRRLVDLTLVSGHAAESQVTVDVVWMFLEDVLVQLLGAIEMTLGLEDACQVVCHRHGDGVVVTRVVLGIGTRALQRFRHFRTRLLEVAQSEGIFVC